MHEQRCAPLMIGRQIFVVDGQRLAEFAFSSCQISLIVQQHRQAHAGIANLIVIRAVQRQPVCNYIAQQRLRLGQSSLALQQQAVIALGDRSLRMPLAVGPLVAQDRVELQRFSECKISKMPRLCL